MKKKKDQINEEEYNEIEQEEYEEYEEEESDLQTFVQKYSTLIIIASVALIAVVAFLFYFRTSSSETESAASLALSRIQPYYLSSNYEIALNGNPQAQVRGQSVQGLKWVVSEYEDTDQGKLAALYAGNSLNATGNYNEAISYFEIAADSPSKIVEQGAYAGIAAAKEAQGQYGEAAEEYEKAAKIAEDEKTKGRYLYFAGLAYEKSGNTGRAEEIYNDLIEAKYNFEFVGSAKAGLVRLGTKIE